MGFETSEGDPQGSGERYLPLDFGVMLFAVATWHHHR
jgi:hypothetical protein